MILEIYISSIIFSFVVFTSKLGKETSSLCNDGYSSEYSGGIIWVACIPVINILSAIDTIYSYIKLKRKK